MKKEKLLTIGMATYDDYDGVYFTIQALKLYHPICQTDDVEFVVIDSNPTSEHGLETKKYVTKKIRETYIPYDGVSSSFNKYEVVKHAKGKYILILDCHVLLVPGAIDKLLDYYKENPNCKNLIQGPYYHDDLNSVNTHWVEKWRNHNWGMWSNNKEAYDKGLPFEIPMQGMGLLSFEKENWRDISPHFRGFGGEEGYIAEKFKQNGGKNICIPQLKWNHRFGRVNGTRYKLTLDDRIFNYFVGWLEIYNNPEHEMVKSIYDYFTKQTNEKIVMRIFKEAKKITGIDAQ